MCDTTTLISAQQSDLHSCWIIYTKSDGKERLTVTDTKVLMSDNNNSSNNRGLVLPNVDSTTTTPSDDDDDEEIDGTVMLDPEFQPEPPIANNAESQQIYREHQRLAKEYLLLDTKLSYAQVFKENLLEEISPVERQEKQELLKKMSEKEELLDLYNNLKQQLETMRAQQPISSNTAAAATNTTSTGALQHELVSDDGWVVIAPQQNT